MSEETIKLIIADGEGCTCDTVCSLLTGEPQYEVVGRAVNSDECLSLTFIKQPDLMVLDFALSPRSALEVCEQLTLQRGTLGFIVVLKKQPDEKLFRALMESGVSDYIVAPLQKERLLQVLQQAHQRLGRRQQFSLNPHHRVIAVTAPRRACGRSLLAVNLSCAIAGCEPTRDADGNSVALADFNVRSSDACLMLDTFPRHSLANVAHGGGVDTDVMNTLLESHSSGVNLLIAGAVESYDSRELSRATVLSTLATLRHRFAFTVVDAGEPGSIATETVLSLSDRVVMLVAIDKIRIQAARRYVAHLLEMGVDQRKMCLVANDIRPDSRLISSEQVETQLGMPVAARLSYERLLISDSVNLGMPFVLSEPDKSISRVVQDLAVELSGGRLRTRHGRRLFDQVADLFRKSKHASQQAASEEELAEAA